ncbi:uncharacterized protein LOC134832660 [Culicoides brevitarsis]|uniref:uncharacterized protein LOC134832660 n=1 Tax=Culicoides brevitarsis TaxID=469753 RepID=UPI00307B1EB4
MQKVHFWSIMRNYHLLFLVLCNFSPPMQGMFTKFYKVGLIGECVDHHPETLPLDFGKLRSINNKPNSPCLITGMIEARKKIEGDLDMQIDAQRCDPSGDRCVSFSNNTISNICNFIPNNPIFGDVFAKLTKPPLKCFPIKVGKYISQNTTFDMSPFNMLPTQGFKWKVNFYFYKSGSRELLGCWHTEAVISQSSSRKGK